MEEQSTSGVNGALRAVLVDKHTQRLVCVGRTHSTHSYPLCHELIPSIAIKELHVILCIHSIPAHTVHAMQSPAKQAVAKG